MVEVAVIQEFLACAGEARSVVAAHQAGQGLSPVDAQALELFQERVFDQRLGHVLLPCPSLADRRGDTFADAGDDLGQNRLRVLSFRVSVEIQNDAVAQHGGRDRRRCPRWKYAGGPSSGPARVRIPPAPARRGASCRSAHICGTSRGTERPSGCVAITILMACSRTCGATST